MKYMSRAEREIHTKIQLVSGTLNSVVQVSPVCSVPPQGKLKVTNLYVHPITGKLSVEYQDGSQ